LLDQIAHHLTRDIHGVWVSKDQFYETALHPGTALALECVGAGALTEVKDVFQDLHEHIVNRAPAWRGWTLLYEGNAR
jgi:hypothetical protein